MNLLFKSNSIITFVEELPNSYRFGCDDDVINIGQPNSTSYRDTPPRQFAEPVRVNTDQVVEATDGCILYLLILPKILLFYFVNEI